MSRRLVVLLVAGIVLVAGVVTALVLRGDVDPVTTTTSSARADVAQTVATTAPEQTGAPAQAGDSAQASSSGEVSATESAAVAAAPATPAPAPLAPAAPGAPIDPNHPVSDPATREEGPPVDVTPVAGVAVNQAADFGNGIVASVTSVESVVATAVQPGETAGPAAAVRVSVHNGTNAAVNLDGLAVNAAGPDGTPLIPNFTAPASPLSGALEPGQSREGTYVFRTDAGLAGLSIDVHHDTAVNFIVVKT